MTTGDFYQSGLGPKDAAARREVLVQRPGKLDVTGTLMCWPIPPEIRKAGNRRGRARTKARVQLWSGAYISVDPRYVFPIEKGTAP